MPLGQVDELARLVNKGLRNFESMLPEQQAALRATNPKIGGLKQLDLELGNNLNQTLRRLGEPGLIEYESRYAALSSVRSQLQKRMNMAELHRTTPWGGARAKLGFGKAAQIAGASQAAAATLSSIGRQLQQGMKALGESGIQAQRGVATRSGTIKLLPSGPIRLPGPSYGEVRGVPAMPAVETGQRTLPPPSMVPSPPRGVERGMEFEGKFPLEGQMAPRVIPRQKAPTRPSGYVKAESPKPEVTTGEFGTPAPVYFEAIKWAKNASVKELQHSLQVISPGGVLEKLIRRELKARGE